MVTPYGKSKTLSVQAVLRHSVEIRRDGHGQYAEQKASEDLQHRMGVLAYRRYPIVKSDMDATRTPITYPLCCGVP
jgi:hypothetical protein